MRVFLKPSKDTTIYQRFPDINTGLDEILELGKLIKFNDVDNMYMSSSCRALINFDVTESMFPADAKYYLNLYIANAQDVDRNQVVDIYPIETSWNEGNGYFYQLTNTQSTNGATWKNADTNVSWSLEGGDYMPGPTASFVIKERPLTDVRVEVTNIMSYVVSGELTPWNGIILKYPETDEISSLIRSNIKVFSGDTFTIFSPRLEVVWNTQTFITGSFKPIPSPYVSVLPRTLKETYKPGEISKIYLTVRDRFPDKRYDSVQRFKNVYYLPSSSYFRIKDEVSDIEIYRFDEYSSVECDAQGPYILFDTRGLEPNRYYNIDLKVEMPDGQVFFPLFNYRFKVEIDG
jgi:hypothetical protein